MKRPSQKPEIVVAGAALFGAIALFLFTPPSRAAQLNFATAEGVSLLSPTTTLTVATGSVADALEVTTSSVLVTLSSSTGASFTLLSPSYDLTVATSSTGGAATVSCSSGIESAVISQVPGSTIYTITTAGTNCSSASAPVISNIAASGITASSATVNWTTNILATTTIEYGTTLSYGSSANDTNLTTGDSVTLSGLSASAPYHFAIIAYANGTSTTSSDKTFIMSAASSPGAGGSFGVANQYGLSSPSSFPATPATPTTTSLLAELNNLEAELASLEAQAAKVHQSGSNTTAGGGSSQFTFTRPLERWE